MAPAGVKKLSDQPVCPVLYVKIVSSGKSEFGGIGQSTEELEFIS